MVYDTEQEQFWAGEFGDAYIERNRSERLLASTLAFFSKVLSKTHSISSVLELGANIGMNLQAIHLLLPQVRIGAVEINEKAVRELNKHNWLNVYHQSILEFSSVETWDLVFTKGVLIHLSPDKLPSIYDLLFKLSNRYILFCEYYNPTPVEVNYRGYSNRLFKRDFAGEILDRRMDLTLLDYGFVYHRDNSFPQDDMTWFLMEKR